ncbi:DegQ family serine endoprotease [Noviherbaspirillum agri]
MKREHLAGRTAAAILVALLLPACSDADKEQAAPAPPAAQTPAPATTPGIQLPSFVELVKQQGNAVVNVSGISTVADQAGAPQLREGDPMLEFFRRFGVPPEAGEAPSGSLGSGFIISADGFILTNAHVVADVGEINVRLTDKREYKAKVIGIDPYTDVALIKIEATGLPVVKIGDPNSLEPGEWVAAIGAPFGFDNSVTVGVVSAKGRVLPNESYVPFIQTDVAVNPGNSGGPLFSTRSEVIGINSQIYSQTGGYMGISFAIPIDIAMDVAKQLRENGEVTRGRIGVQVQELTVDLANSFGLKEPVGALVAAVEKGGPAHKAGIVPGDVILSLNGQKVETSADLARLVAGTKPGTAVDIEVWRKGSSAVVKATVDKLEEPPQE